MTVWTNGVPSVTVALLTVATAGFTTSVSVPVLLPGVGSVVPAGTVAVAVFTMVPVVAVTLAVTKQVAVPVLGIVVTAKPVASCAGVGAAGPTAPLA